MGKFLSSLDPSMLNQESVNALTRCLTTKETETVTQKSLNRSMSKFGWIQSRILPALQKHL